jgi:hypothetical protein
MNTPDNCYADKSHSAHDLLGPGESCKACGFVAGRPITDDPDYDAAMNALHDASSEAHAWDIAWLPLYLQPRMHEALRILGAAIARARAAGFQDGFKAGRAAIRSLAPEVKP